MWTYRNISLRAFSNWNSLLNLALGILQKVLEELLRSADQMELTAVSMFFLGHFSLDEAYMYVEFE